MKKKLTLKKIEVAVLNDNEKLIIQAGAENTLYKSCHIFMCNLYTKKECTVAW